MTIYHSPIFKKRFSEDNFNSILERDYGYQSTHKLQSDYDLEKYRINDPLTFHSFTNSNNSNGLERRDVLLFLYPEAGFSIHTFVTKSPESMKSNSILYGYPEKQMEIIAPLFVLFGDGKLLDDTREHLNYFDQHPKQRISVSLNYESIEKNNHSNNMSKFELTNLTPEVLKDQISDNILSTISTKKLIAENWTWGYSLANKGMR